VLNIIILNLYTSLYYCTALYCTVDKMNSIEYSYIKIQQQISDKLVIRDPASLSVD